MTDGSMHQAEAIYLYYITILMSHETIQGPQISDVVTL